MQSFTTEDNIVRVAAGNVAEMKVAQQYLYDNGINAQVVGDELTAGLGTATNNSVELWVRHADAGRAGELLAQADGEHRVGYAQVEGRQS